MAHIGMLVRSAYRNLDLTSLLREPIDVLIGVSSAAKDELRDHNIVSVFDLAASALFREAATLVAAADDPTSEWAQAGRPPRTVVDSAIVDLPIETVADRAIEDLRSFSDTAAGRVSAALNVSTIRELAVWPPYLAARQIFHQLAGRGEVDSVWDPGIPQELVPTMGRHPTERVFYQNILLDRFLDPPSLPTKGMRMRALPAGLMPFTHAMSESLEAAGQVDVASTLLRSPGFDRVAVGAIVQFSQSWYASALSLGQLLHSLALAPGESTRIAMIDWQRRERGNRTEGTQESDQLTSELSRNRALDEVVRAVASEVQSGSSASQGSGESWGFGKSGGGGGSYGGEGQSYGFGGGYSLGYGTGKSQASSWGVSTGNRDLRSELTQNIQDLTHQASTMTRNRWATVVQEVSQQEHEQLSTRAVTNYNHMHALTVQYYEVVQLYRVAIDIERITRCLFVPMKVLDFRRFEVITRFRRILAAVALSAQVRATLLAAANSVVLVPARRSQPWGQGSLDLLKTLFGRTVGYPDSAEISFPRTVQPWGLMVGIVGDNSNTQEFPFESALIEFDGAPAQTIAITESGPTEPSDLGRKYIDFRPVLGTGENAKDFWNVRAISFKRKAGKETFAGEIFVTTAIYPYGTTSGQTQGKGSLPLFLQVQANEMLVPIYTILRTTTDDSLAQHLDENALFYSQQIWLSLDSTELSLALAAYTIGGQPLMQVIDPTPISIAGNYLVFRYYGTDASWQEFLTSKKLAEGPVSSTMVPLPSGGVFAEAVMGRANSAEKLDMTRFWNWQDSPIPITAPDIAALQAGSRHQATDLETGKLSPSVLNIMNPPQLPDPTGMTAALTALAQGTMFRDMSGLAETIGLAGTGLQEAFKGSSDAQKYAMENFKTAASLIGKASAKPSTTSEQGAKVNQGKDMDRRKQQDPGGVGQNEQEAFSPPPLVEAEMQGSDPSEWQPYPGDEREFELKSGYDGPVGSTEPTGKQNKIIPVTFDLRWFVPSEAFRIPGMELVAMRGDNRSYDQAGAGSSRAQLKFNMRIDADHMRVTEAGKPVQTFGETELYWSSDTTQATNSPTWWREINAGALPIGNTLATFSDAKALSASYRTVNGAIEVTLQLHGAPHFPWTAAGLGNLPGVSTILGALLNTQVADVDAVVRITITKRRDGNLEYTTSGWHDLFGGWELYVNSEAAWLTGGEGAGARATDPRFLWQLTGQTRPINELAQPLREPHK